MKKKIAILGSTGSIGCTTLEILKKNKNSFHVELLSTNKNIKKILDQSTFFKVKNIIIYDKKKYLYLTNQKKLNKINIYNNVSDYLKYNKKKLDYVMSAITGLQGLRPTLDIIKFTKKIAIANKESIICGWSLIKRELKKHGTKFSPVDSEHFSILELIKNEDKNNIKNIFLTASGGPFLKTKIKNLKKITPKKAIDHPTWKMGKKISVDSATLINKVFELIEAQKIFDFDIKKIKIIVQPTSYVHGIVEFNNGITKFLSHPTSMLIPIYNSLFDKKNDSFRFEKLDFSKLNNLNFIKIDKNKFPIEQIIKQIPNTDSLFETILISANDKLVDLFLKKKISFNEIYIILNKILKLSEYRKYKKIKPKKLKQILDLDHIVRLKTQSLSVKSSL